MSEKIPLLNAPEEAAIAWRNGQAVSAARFLGDVAAVAARLPAGDIVNLCEDRYHFLVAFAAAACRGRRNLLPPSRAEQAIADLLQTHPGAQVLSDEAVAPALASPPARARHPDIDSQQIVAVLFTSGSTGEPKAQAKTWGELAGGARRLRPRLPFSEAQGRLVATVPPQHMFGLETTIMQPLAVGTLVDASRPFFPGDVRERLAALPPPRALVTTPLHLKSCLDAGLEWPSLDFVLSATAPMPPELATQAEALLGAPVLEIYGSTETGAIATRRTTESEDWLPLEGVTVIPQAEGALARAAHLPAPVLLSDQVERTADGRFKLLGRNADLIKIAGKRTSLAELNLKLTAIPGVQDGAFVLPETEGQRLAALVVAPGLSRRDILEQLRRTLDPVFLPRPLLHVDQLPRNETGKLPRQGLLELLRRAEASSCPPPSSS